MVFQTAFLKDAPALSQAGPWLPTTVAIQTPHVRYNNSKLVASVEKQTLRNLFQGKIYELIYIEVI